MSSTYIPSQQVQHPARCDDSVQASERPGGLFKDCHQEREWFWYTFFPSLSVLLVVSPLCQLLSRPSRSSRPRAIYVSLSSNSLSFHILQGPFRLYKYVWCADT